MKKSSCSSKYLKTFDPLDSSSEVFNDLENSCAFLKEVQTVKQDENGQRGNAQIRKRKETSVSVYMGDSKKSSRIKDNQSNKIRLLEQQIHRLNNQVNEKNNKLILITQHLQSLEYQQQILQQTRLQKQISYESQLHNSIKYLVQKQQQKSNNSPQYFSFISSLISSNQSEILSNMFSKLRQLFLNRNQQSLKPNKSHKIQQLSKLNTRLFQQCQTLKQDNNKLVIEYSLQINSMNSVSYQTLSLLKSISQKYNTKVNVGQYLRLLQRVNHSSRTLQSLQKNLKQFKQTSQKKGLIEKNQQLFFDQVSFKTKMIQQQKSQLQDLISNLTDIYHQIQSSILLQKTQQPLPSLSPTQTPLAQTFKSSTNLFSKRNSVHLPSSSMKDPGTTTKRSKLYQQITNTKSQRQLMNHKSLKNLKQRLTKRSLAGQRYF